MKFVKKKVYMYNTITMSPPRAKLEEHSRRVRRMIHAARERAEFEDAEARVLDLVRTANRSIEGAAPGECGHEARKCMCHLIRTRVSYADEQFRATANRIVAVDAPPPARMHTVRLRANDTQTTETNDDGEESDAESED